MATSAKIRLFDIDGIRKPWSPNTWKTRFLLNYKNIPYSTEWVSMQNIASLNKSNGHEPSVGPWYTLPAIADETVSPPIHIVESSKIATYLEENYPDRPLVTVDLLEEQRPHIDLIMRTVMKMIPIVVGSATGNLEGETRNYYVRSRPQIFGSQLQGLYDPSDEAKCSQSWNEFESAMDGLAEYVSKVEHSDASLFSTGDEPIYADFLLVSFFLWMKEAGPRDGWEKIKEWNDGMWDRQYERCETYMQVI